MNLVKIFSWFLILPAIIPLVYWDGLSFPYMTPKTIMFRGLAIIIAGLFAYLVFVKKEQFYFHRLKSIWAWSPGILVVVAIVTSLMGGNFFHGFWSSLGRGDGILTLISAIVLFYVSLVSFDKTLIFRLFKTIAVVGTLVTIYTLLQWLEMNTHKNLPIIKIMEGRIGGTLNNAAFLASYLSMTFFATLYVTLNAKGKWFWIGFVASVAQITAIIMSATRSSLLGLILALGIFVIYQSILGFGKIKKISRIALLLMIILSALFFTFRAELKGSNIESIRRIAQISLKEGTVSNRIFVWKNLFPEAMKKPILGYGSENIETVFNRVYDPTKISEQWFDRSHNAFLDYLLQYGLVGLLLYVLMILSLLVVSFKIWRNGEKYGAYLFFAGLLYVVNNFFVFDTSVTLWLFVTLLAVVLSSEKEEASGESIKPFFCSKYVGYIIVLSLIASFIPVVINPLRASNFLFSGTSSSKISDYEKQLKRGYNIGTYADVEYGYLAHTLFAEKQIKEFKGNDLLVAYNTTLSILTENFYKYPDNTKNALNLAHLIDITPVGIERDLELLTKAIDRVIFLSPKRLEGWFLKANIPIRKSQEVSDNLEKKKILLEAIDVLKRYIETVPTEVKTHFVIAGIYFSIGENDLAKEWAEKVELFYNGELDIAKEAVTYYISHQNWIKALPFMEVLVTSESKDVVAKYELAKLYYLTGNTEKSLEIYNQLLILNPDLVNSDPAFVKAIESIKGGNK